MSTSIPRADKRARIVFKEGITGTPEGDVIPAPILYANRQGFEYLSKFFARLAEKFGDAQGDDHEHLTTNEPPFDETLSDLVDFTFSQFREDDQGRVGGWITPDQQRRDCVTRRYHALIAQSEQLKRAWQDEDSVVE